MRTTQADSTARVGRTVRREICTTHADRTTIQGDINSHTSDVSRAIQHICKLEGFSIIFVEVLISLRGLFLSSG
jgi:hypothetical protein